MLRHAIRKLARPATRTNGALTTAYARAWAASESTASDASVAAFMEKFELNKTSPTMEAPLTPSSFVDMKPRETTGTGTPDKLKFNFYLPHEVPHNGQEVRHDDDEDEDESESWEWKRGFASDPRSIGAEGNPARRDAMGRAVSDRARRSMGKNITHLNDTRAWRVGARARGETTGKTCGSFDRVRLDAVQKPMERGVHATTTTVGRERDATTY